MKADKVWVNQEVTDPESWKGTYTCNNDYNSPNWTWYVDGDSRKTNYPNVTYAFGATLEVDKNSTERIGFHVSYPLGGQNARFLNSRSAFRPTICHSATTKRQRTRVHHKPTAI